MRSDGIYFQSIFLVTSESSGLNLEERQYKADILVDADSLQADPVTKPLHSMT